MTGRATARLVAWVTAGLAIASLAVVAAVRVHDHRWVWQALPARLHVCGRDYSNGGQLVPARRVHAERDHVVGHFLTVSGRREVWGAEGPPGDRCGTVVYVPAGDSRFSVYALEGGP